MQKTSLLLIMYENQDYLLLQEPVTTERSYRGSWNEASEDGCDDDEDCGEGSGYGATSSARPSKI